MLPDTEAVPFGDFDELARKLATGRFAAFILEPIQAESGVCVPPREYLQQAQALCRRHGTLLVLDEVQTGMYRTGRFLAAHHFAVEADMVVLAKALSGGLVPCGGVLMSDAVCNSVYSSLQRAVIHTSTYSENSLANACGIGDARRARGGGARRARPKRRRSVARAACHAPGKVRDGGRNSRAGLA